MKNYFYFLLTLPFFIACSSSEKKESKNITNSTKESIVLQLYSLRDNIESDYIGTIQQVGKMGFTSVEAANYEDEKFYGRTPEEFKKDLVDNNLVLLSSHTTKQLSDEELRSQNFTESLKWWDRCIADHKAAGAQYIVAPWMDVPNSLKDLQTYCDYYNEIGKRCKEKGLKFGYHNHSHEFTKIDGQMMYDYMLEHTNPEYVFFEMDVYWIMRAGESSVAYFKKYPNRFTLLHIKDEKELGESGMVGFDAIFKNVAIAGTKNLIIEVERYDYAPFESVKRSFDYLLNCPLVQASYE